MSIKKFVKKLAKQTKVNTKHLVKNLVPSTKEASTVFLSAALVSAGNELGKETVGKLFTK